MTPPLVAISFTCADVAYVRQIFYIVTPPRFRHRLHVYAVRLPQLLAQSALTAAEVTQVQKLLGDFLRFMQKNHATFFVQEYEEEEPVGQSV